jgi:hypothetical protein
MHELATSAIGAEPFLVELFACLGHVVGWQVGFLNQLMLTVSVGALVSPSAVVILFPTLAQFSLLFSFEFLDKLFARGCFGIHIIFRRDPSVSRSIGISFVTVVSRHKP